MSETYTDNEVRGAVRNLQKWRENAGRDYPFVVGAVPVVLWALEQADPSLCELSDDVLTPFSTTGTTTPEVKSDA